MKQNLFVLNADGKLNDVYSVWYIVFCIKFHRALEFAIFRFLFFELYIQDARYRYKFMPRWILSEKEEIAKMPNLKLHPLLVQLLFSRGIKTKEEIEKFVFPDYDRDFHDPFLFSDMEKVVKRIEKAREKKEKVAIFGDYDADGITASVIIKETLDLLGIESFTYIPDKMNEGYGMNVAAVEKFEKENVSLIITVDCGITNIAEVERANSLGIDVIITDHHHMPEKIPEAFAVVDPHDPRSEYPFRDLAGVGVAFKVVQAVFQRLLEDKIQQTKWMLDLVAIGTIADCVPLVGENRLFAKYGLIVLSKTKRVGLKELFSVGRININEKNLPDTRKISFYIAPRINAAGRIKHANLAYDLIFEKDVAKARTSALEIEAQNSERQKVTEKVVEEVSILARSAFKDKKFIFAASEHFPIGVLGLAAGKIAQQFLRPVAIFRKDEDASTGSFRSIPQINIIETIGKFGGMLMKFGGHSQAAGATIKNENFVKFCEKMSEEIEKKLKDCDFSEEILVDAKIDAKDVDFALVDDIEKLKPFGEGNREPVFMIKNLTVRETRIVGNGNKHIKLFLACENEPKIFEAISFNGYEKFSHINVGDKIDILCNLQKDEWNGNIKIQFTLIDARVSQSKNF